MAQYLSYDGLKTYDEKLKQWVKNTSVEQLSALPTTAEEKAKYTDTIVQYVGATTDTLTKGYFYTLTKEGEEETATWKQINIQPKVDPSSIIDDTKAATDTTYSSTKIDKQIKDNAKDATYKAASAEGADDAVTIEEAIKALEDATFLCFKGTATAAITAPADGDLYYFNIAATESDPAVIGWKFYSTTDTAWKDLNDATVSTRVDALETQVGKGKIVNAYNEKVDLVDIINLLTGDATKEGSILNLIKKNAGNADSSMTEIEKYESIETEGTYITIEEYNELSDEDKAKYKAVEKTLTINEALQAVKDEAGLVEITVAETPSENALKTYVFTQNKEEIGKIDIPKDFLVKSGKIVWFVSETVEEETIIKEMPAGTVIEALPTGIALNTKYIALTLNVKEGAADDETVYIAVTDICDPYTGAEATDKIITVAVSDENVITATIADASIPREKIDADFEADIAAIETAIGTHEVEGEDILYPVADRIKAEAGDGDSNISVIIKYQEIDNPDTYITVEAYLALEEEERAKYKAIEEPMTINDAIDSLKGVVDEITAITDEDINKLFDDTVTP